MSRHFVTVNKIFLIFAAKLQQNLNHNMTQRHLLLVFSFALALTSYGQQPLSDNERKYLVYTVQPGQKPFSAKSFSNGFAEEQAEEEEVDSMGIWFPFLSLCDWQPGMRFMVMPDKKDLVIKTFADAATGRMVSSQALMHKVLVYEGHDDANGGLHEHVNFVCEETGAHYYYEVPTASFDDYCYTKFGIPALAYLGEVDMAREKFVGKKLITVADRYYIDDPKTADGCVEIRNVPRDTEVEVVAVGVGTRSFPVKIIVREEGENGRQFFQNVAISKTNSGLRDDEFEISNMIFHKFDASFKMADDNMSEHPLYQKYFGKEVYTLQETFVKNDKGNNVKLPRLTLLTMKKIRSQIGSEYAKVTLYDNVTGDTYTREVLFVNKNRIGVDDGQRDMYVDNIFALGNPHKMKGVREENWKDLKDGMVRKGFTSDEVRVALGEPTSTGKSGVNTVWFYRGGSAVYARKVIFNSKTMKVISVVK
jgi:hypothetical protein